MQSPKQNSTPLSPTLGPRSPNLGPVDWAGDAAATLLGQPALPLLPLVLPACTFC